jgi:hypothetical protein
VILDAAVDCTFHPVEDLEHGTSLDVEPGFLSHFARDRFAQRLADLDDTARQAPLPLKGRLTPPSTTTAPTLTTGRSGKVLTAP